MLIISLLAALLTVTPSQEEQKSYWLTAGGDDYYVFVEGRSVVREGPVVAAWTAYVFAPDRRPTSGAWAMHIRQEWDCVARKGRQVAVAVFDENFQVIESASSDIEEWEVVFPDSISEATMSVLCDGQTPPAIIEAASLRDLTTRFLANLPPQ